MLTQSAETVIQSLLKCGKMGCSDLTIRLNQLPSLVYKIVFLNDTCGYHRHNIILSRYYIIKHAYLSSHTHTTVNLSRDNLEKKEICKKSFKPIPRSLNTVFK